MTRYQLTIEAERIKKSLTLRSGTYFATVSVLDESNNSVIVLGSTEELHLEPRMEWQTHIWIEMDITQTHIPANITVQIRESRQHLTEQKIEGTTDLQPFKIVAEADFDVKAIYQSPVHTQTKDLKGGSIIRVTCMESILGAFNPNTKTNIQFRLLNVKNIDPGILGLGRTDPFVKLQKRNWDPEKGVVQWITVHRTEYMLNNLNPVFQAFSLSLETLCYADPQWPLRLIVLDWERSGKHRTLGCYYTTWEELKQLVATNGNADRSKALTISMEESAIAMALLIILQANESDA